LKLADSQQALREAEAKEQSDKILNDATIESKVQASAKAKFDVQRVEHALSQMTLRAPSAGSITLLQHWAGSNMTTYRMGDRAWPGAAIAELPDANTLRVSARVDETERGRLAPKQSVTVQFNSIADRQFTGHIEQIGEIASLDFSSGWPLTRNFTLYIVLDQTDARFKPGITGDVKVLIEKVPNAIIIPASAMFQKSGENIVYVRHGGEFQETPIQVGRKSGDKILVAQGVSPGDKLALRDPTAKE
jgi:HlyD family secretion protein